MSRPISNRADSQGASPSRFPIWSSQETCRTSYVCYLTWSPLEKGRLCHSFEGFGSQNLSAWRTENMSNFKWFWIAKPCNIWHGLPCRNEDCVNFYEVLDPKTGQNLTWPPLKIETVSNVKGFWTPKPSNIWHGLPWRNVDSVKFWKVLIPNTLQNLTLSHMETGRLCQILKRFSCQNLPKFDIISPGNMETV